MTIPELECCLCASIMDEPTAKLSPMVCTALAFAPDMWESPEAAKVADGIKFALRHTRPLHRKVVEFVLDFEYRKWLYHPTFTQGLPLSCLDEAIRPLLEHYENKRLITVMGDAYALANGQPQKAKQIGVKLMVELEGLLCK